MYSYLADFFSDINKGIIGRTPKRIEIIDNIETMPYLQKNDCMIMKEFIKAGVVDNQLGILKKMWSSIEATTVSDICTAEGRSITIQA